MNKKMSVVALMFFFLSGCAAHVALSPSLESQNNNGSTKYKLAIRGPESEAAALGEQEAVKHCSSKGQRSQIIRNFRFGFVSEIEFYCWDMEVVRRIQEAEARNPSARKESQKQVCVLMPVGDAFVNVCK